MSVGLGWMIEHPADNVTYWHNGGTYGFSAYVAFRPSSHTGVVLLLGQCPPADRALESFGEALLDSFAS